MKRLLNNDTAGAAEAFRNSTAKGDKTSDDCQMAAAELKALAQ